MGCCGIVTVGFVLRFRGNEVVANGCFGDFDMLAVEGISCSVERAEGIAVTDRRLITWDVRRRKVIHGKGARGHTSCSVVIALRKDLR